MTTRATIEGYFNALQAGDSWEVYLADEMVFTSYTSPIREVAGRDAYLESTRGFFGMIESMAVRELIVDGDRAVALTRYQLRPPVGEAFSSDVVELFTIKGDKIATFSIVFDATPYPS